MDRLKKDLYNQLQDLYYYLNLRTIIYTTQLSFSPPCHHRHYYDHANNDDCPGLN